MPPPQPPCPGRARLQRYSFGKASREEAAEVRSHLKYCAGCRAAVGEFRALMADAQVRGDRTAHDEALCPAEGEPPACDRHDPTTLPLHQAAGSDQTCHAARPGPPAEPSAVSGLTEVDDPRPGGQDTHHFHPDDLSSSAETAGFPLPADVNPTFTFGATEPAIPEPEPAFGTAGRRRVTVPGYEILQELGRGGMGVVYKARDTRLRRLVALKMILAGTHASAETRARFRTEAEAVAQLQHPNIVQIYETGEHEGRPYFSLEYVDGGSLDRLNKDHPTTPRAAAALVETLARAMEVAHQRGVVHRDLKPANVLLAVVSGQSSVLSSAVAAGACASLPADHWARTTVPKIADFGLAKRVDEDSSQTQSGAILGTPCYMAPEQAGGKTREVGPAADIYSLGAIFYELLTGRPPFKAGHPVETVQLVLTQDPVPPRRLEPGIPADLETICLKCLEKDPARRYPTAAELANDLRRFLHNEPILARPTPAWERAWKWGKRRPTVAALMGAGLLAVAAAVLFVVWHEFALQAELAQARADERQARQREEEAVEAERRSRLQNEGQRLFDEARLAVSARDWPAARVHLTKALTLVGGEPALAGLRDQAQALSDRVEAELRAEADRAESGARFRRFAALRDEAQFLGTLYTGMDLSANLRATRQAVGRALAVYAIDLDAASPPAFDPYLDEPQRAEVLADCYLLVLILAETEAQSAAADGSPGRVREAVRLLGVALRFGSASRAWHLRHARYLRQLGDAPAADCEEEAAAAAPVVLVFDHFLVADEFYRQGKFAEAGREFDEVLRRKPGHFWAQYLNALCLLRQHRPAEARLQLGACLAQRPGYVWLYLLRGFANSELKAFDAAEADFAAAAGMELDESSRYVLLVNRGVLRVRQDRLGEAVDDLTEAVRLKPGEYQAYVNLAQAYRRLNKPELAVEQLNVALRLEPGMAHLYRLRARLRLEQKEFGRALEDFDHAVRLDRPDSPYLADDHADRGRLLLRAGRHADAVAALDAALARRGDHAVAQLLRAEALFHLERFADVVAAFDRYLETGKPLESVYRGRGLARAELGKYPGAIEDYTKALELKPTAEVFVYRGWAHLVCEAPKLALRDFELALGLDPKNAEALAGRGMVLAGMGRHAEAQADAEAAVRLDPESPRLLYNAARIHATAATNRGDTRAIELLRDALTHVPPEGRAAFWSRYIQPDAALQPLRSQPRFQKMIDELIPPR